ncbi:MAG: helix-turn-helix domain-containing protein [Chitinophagales bacterium]|nr:helix-turn-helix domain-containing protein [Chitinophagales bacterium]
MESKSINIGVLLPFDYSLFQIALILNILKTTRNLCIDKGVDIHIHIVQTQGQINEHSDTFFHFDVISNFAEASFDYVFLPPLASDDYAEIVANNRVFRDWIVQCYNNSSNIYAFGNAAALLAFSGLLDESEVNIPELKNDFFLLFPNISKSQSSLVERKGNLNIYSGGAKIYFPLFELAKQWGGSDVVYQLANQYQVDLNLKENRYFFEFEFVFETSDEQINQVLENIHLKYSNIFLLDEVLEGFNGSRRTFNRNFKQHLKMTPIEYLQNVRIAHSKKLLLNTELTIDQISQQVGYEDVKSFRIIFARINGILPLEYKKRLTMPIVD